MIPVDISHLTIPEGYQVVRVGLPKKGEEFINSEGKVSTAHCDYKGLLVPILKPNTLEPVSVKIKPLWLTKDPDGTYTLHTTKPTYDVDFWLSGSLKLYSPLGMFEDFNDPLDQVPGGPDAVVQLVVTGTDTEVVPEGRFSIGDKVYPFKGFNRPEDTYPATMEDLLGVIGTVVGPKHDGNWFLVSQGDQDDPFCFNWPEDCLAPVSEFAGEIWDPQLACVCALKGWEYLGASDETRSFDMSQHQYEVFSGSWVESGNKTNLSAKLHYRRKALK